jgi:5'-methylthioadenosine phosphorylase
MKAEIGIIGGSGLYDIEGVNTAFLPRHGRGHRIMPTEVNSRANIWALKSLGVKQIIAVHAVGSLAEEYKPGDFVSCN